ncbi:glycoside hydrolase family 16 protein, partial [bacterium]|nr:glycoside hydrolase family 16 protein [bacterium]
LKDSKIKFDIRTSYPVPVPKIITPEIFAQYTGFPLVDSFQLHRNNYYTFPSGSQGWQTLAFDVSNVNTINGVQFAPLPPDFNTVSRVQLLFLQSTTSQINGSGFVDIDNLRIGEVSEDDGGIVPEYFIEFDSVSAGDIPQNIFFPGQRVSVTVRAEKSGVQEYCTFRLVVYDSSFSWPLHIGDIVYDSAVNNENYTTLLGKGENEFHTFHFWLPAHAPAGNYTVLGILENSNGTLVHDTTGPDRSFDDRTVRAYISAFTVNPYSTGTGPVAILEVDNEPASIDQLGNAAFTVDASRSFHVDAPVKEIISYEWDTDNDGIFETTGSENIVINFVVDEFDPLNPQPAVVPVSLRVSDNAVPAQSATVTHMVSCVAQGNMAVQVIGTDLSYLSEGKAIVYGENYEPLGSEFVRITDVSGQAAWQNLPVGDYIVEAHNYDTTPFTDVELWASRTITVNIDQTTTEMIQRDMPYIENAELRYFDNDGLITSSTEVPPGTSVSFNITVKNDSFDPQTVRIQVIADRDQEAGYDLIAPVSDVLVIPAGQSRILETAVNPLHPTDDLSEAYQYTVLVQTLINGVYRKTGTQNWTAGFVTRPLPIVRNLVDQFAFSGFVWKKTDWKWQSGLHNDNVMLENDALTLRVKNNVGVGGQVVTVKDDFHYGTYRARIKLTDKYTQFPEGVVFGFFYYWNDPNDASVYQEIDFEFRTHDRNNDENLPQVTVSVHNTREGETLEVFSYQIPLPNIHDDTVFEWRWQKESVSFYVNGQLALDKYGVPAIVDELNFPGRIPDKPSKLFLNHWSGQPGNSFAGTPPQGLGDFISVVKSVSYVPAVSIKKVEIDPANNPVLQIKAYSTLTVDIFGCDNIGDELWQSIGSVSGGDEHQFTDTYGNGKEQRYYRLRYHETTP